MSEFPDLPASQPAAEPAGQTFVNADAGNIPIDSDETSDYYSDRESDLTSISSSVKNYQYENGRRYHGYKQGKYMMPNDEDEMDRLDLVHHLFLLLMKGNLHVAPLKNPQAILDLGTGTGVWAIDIADMYPSATIIGNDLSPIQPTWVPPNVQFVVDDFELDWQEKQDHFDFVHARTIAGCVKDWPRLLQQVMTHLKPGGYFEIVESAIWAWSDDGSLKEDSPYMDFLRSLEEGSKMAGKPMNIAADLRQWVTDAGFRDVTENVYVVPFGTWPKEPPLKEVGKFQHANVQVAVEAYSLRLFTQVLGWSEEKAKLHQALVKHQLRSRSVHAYTKVYAVYGQKPL